MDPDQSCSWNSVLSVEELIKEQTVDIPQNYIFPDQEPLPLSNCATFPTVPTIDMKKLVLGEAMDLELEKLPSTCKDCGIFQLLNHGLGSSLLKNLKREIEEFFKLPLEEKMKYKLRSGDVEGYGTIVRSEAQRLDWGDRFFMTINHIDRRKPNLFPELPTALRHTSESYFSELRELAMKLLLLMGKP